MTPRQHARGHIVRRSLCPPLDLAERVPWESPALPGLSYLPSTTRLCGRRSSLRAWLILCPEGSLATTAWASAFGMYVPSLRPGLRTARAVFLPGVLRPALRVVLAALRPVLRATRATFRPVLRTTRAVLRPVRRAVRVVLPVVFFVAIVFLTEFRCSLVETLHLLQTLPAHNHMSIAFWPGRCLLKDENGPLARHHRGVRRRGLHAR